MPHLRKITHTTNHIFLSLWVWSVHSKAQVIMENRLGKMHMPQYLRLTSWPFSKYPLSTPCGYLHNAPPSSVCIKDPLCFLYAPMTSSFLHSPLVVNGPSHQPELCDPSVSSLTSCWSATTQIPLFVHSTPQRHHGAALPPACLSPSPLHPENGPRAIQLRIMWELWGDSPQPSSVLWEFRALSGPDPFLP